MLKILFLTVLISFALLYSLYFLLYKKRGFAHENLTLAYKVKLKRNGQQHSRNNLFCKAVNALTAWAFFAGYFLNDAVLAKDNYTNKYQNDNYFKYDINLYSPKKIGLPADCPPKVTVNQVYSKNKLLAVTDCIPGHPGNSPTPCLAPCINLNPPSSIPCATATPAQCVNQPPPQTPPCVSHAVSLPPCAPSSPCAGSGGNISVCSGWYQLFDPGLSDCTNFNQGLNPSTGQCIYTGECHTGTQGQINNQGYPVVCAASTNCAAVNCQICMNWP